VGARHEQRTESELDVGEPLAGRVLDVLEGHAAARLFVAQNARHQLDLGDERRKVRLRLLDLKVRAQAFDIVGGKSHPVSAGEIKHGVETQVPVEMTVQIQQGNGFVNHIFGLTTGVRLCGGRIYPAFGQG
jgi:hypothetical protein